MPRIITSFRLSDAERRLLRELRESRGDSDNTATLRAVLAEEAERRGIEPPASKPIARCCGSSAKRRVA